MADTVAIHHPQDPTRPTVIPADRYDPDRHTIWGDTPKEPTDGCPERAAAPDEERPEQEDDQPPDAEVEAEDGLTDDADA